MIQEQETPMYFLKLGKDLLYNNRRVFDDSKTPEKKEPFYVNRLAEVNFSDWEIPYRIMNSGAYSFYRKNWYKLLYLPQALNPDIEQMISIFKKGCDLDPEKYKESIDVIYQNCDLEASVILSLFRFNYKVSISGINNPLDEAMQAFEKACKRTGSKQNDGYMHCRNWITMLDWSFADIADALRKSYGKPEQLALYKTQWDIINKLIDAQTLAIKYVLNINIDPSMPLPDEEKIYYAFDNYNPFLFPVMKEVPWFFVAVGHLRDCTNKAKSETMQINVMLLLERAQRKLTALCRKDKRSNACSVKNNIDPYDFASDLSPVICSGF
jgi:hypothetical protein